MAEWMKEIPVEIKIKKFIDSVEVSFIEHECCCGTKISGIKIKAGESFTIKCGCGKIHMFSHIEKEEPVLQLDAEKEEYEKQAGVKESSAKETQEKMMREAIEENPVSEKEFYTGFPASHLPEELKCVDPVSESYPGAEKVKTKKTPSTLKEVKTCKTCAKREKEYPQCQCDNFGAWEKKGEKEPPNVSPCKDCAHRNKIPYSDKCKSCENYDNWEASPQSLEETSPCVTCIYEVEGPDCRECVTCEEFSNHSRKEEM